MNSERLADFIFELQHLKQVSHEGWKMAGIQTPDSVAEHSLLAAQIGYFLAETAGASTAKVLKMLIFHDMAEARIGDLHRLAQRYFPNKVEAEKKALEEQTEFLPNPVQAELRENFQEMEAKESLESQIAKDADLLEQAFQAQIYIANGHIAATEWAENAGKFLRTEVAKNLFKAMKETKPNGWFQGLKDFERV